jgi:hypothetical protein
MCIAAAAVPYVAMAVTAATAVASGVQQNKTAKAQASIMQAQAAREREIANLNADLNAKSNRGILARQRAVMAANGGNPSTGTNLLLQADSAKAAKFDEEMIRAGGETQASRLEQQAGLTRMAGKAAQTGGVFRAGTSLLSGYSQIQSSGATPVG